MIGRELSLIPSPPIDRQQLPGRPYRYVRPVDGLGALPTGSELVYAVLVFGGLGVLVWSLGDKQRRSMRIRRRMARGSRSRSRSRSRYSRRSR